MTTGPDILGTDERTNAPGVAVDADVHGGGHTRRDVVSHGVKLAFVAPVISTFLAKDAYAGSGYCSPLGAPCSQDTDCCSGYCVPLSTPVCAVPP